MSMPPPSLPPELEQLRQRALAERIAAAETESSGFPLARFGAALVAAEAAAAVALQLLKSHPRPAWEFVPFLFMALTISFPGLTLIGLLLLRDAAGKRSRVRRLRARTNGVIVGQVTVAAPGDGSWLDQPGFAYTYKVGDDLFTGEHRAEFATNIQWSIQRWHRRHAPGAVIEVNYDPEDPRESVPSKDWRRDRRGVWVRLVAGPTLLLIGALIMLGVGVI